MFGFGKKKDKDEKKGSPSKGYPTQQPAYPTQQPAYPTQQLAYAAQAYAAQPYAAQPPYAGQQPLQSPAHGGELPPPYTPYPQTGAYPQPPVGAYPPPAAGPYPHQPMGAYPQQPMGAYPQQPMGAYPQQPAGAYAAPLAPVPVASGSFDAGARFGAGSTPNIPPPPPGSLPNMAQVAAAQGQTVAVNQDQASWLMGGSGGGMTFW